MADPAIKNANGKAWWSGVVPFVLSSAAGIFFAYGASKATSAALEQRVVSLENDKAAQQKQLDYIREHYAPREEIGPQLKTMQDTLQRVETNQNLLLLRNK